VPADPLERHRRVLLLVVPVVGQDRCQLGIARRLDALVVPVDRLQLLDQRLDRAVAIRRLSTAATAPRPSVAACAVGCSPRARPPVTRAS
jgi:hypothetical protein